MQADAETVPDMRHRELQSLLLELTVDRVEDVLCGPPRCDCLEARMLDRVERRHDLLLPRVGRADDTDPREVGVDELEETRAEIDAPDRSLFQRVARCLARAPSARVPELKTMKT